MGLTYGLLFLNLVGIALLFWVNDLKKEQDERFKKRQFINKEK